MKNVLGIDIGGTTIAFGIVNKDGTIASSNIFETKSFDTPNDLVDTIFNELKTKNLLEPIDGIGIGAPNGNYFTGNIEFAPNLNWKGIIPLTELFKQKFKLPTLLTNDANAAAFGEMIFGNAQDLKDFIVITLGTGLGSGIVVNRKLIYGHDGFAGELGHIRTIQDGRSCGCGRNGCLEAYCSSTGVVRSFHELNSEAKEKSSLFSIEDLTSKTIFEHASNGDVFANEIVDFTAKILGSALADYACFSSPQAYILFGGYAQNGKSFADLVKKYLEENLLVIYKNKIDIRISNLHNENAAILGAAALLFNEYEKK
jgi:glucokinase